MSENVPALPSREIRVGSVTKVANLDGRFGANDTYNLLLVIHDDRLKHWMITDAEIQNIEDRTANNPEDWMEVVLPLWQRILLRLGLL